MLAIFMILLTASFIGCAVVCRHIANERDAKEALREQQAEDAPI